MCKTGESIYKNKGKPKPKETSQKDKSNEKFPNRKLSTKQKANAATATDTPNEIKGDVDELFGEIWEEEDVSSKSEPVEKPEKKGISDLSDMDGL